VVGAGRYICAVELGWTDRGLSIHDIRGWAIPHVASPLRLQSPRT
jgi:hypothetical protein